MKDLEWPVLSLLPLDLSLHPRASSANSAAVYLRFNRRKLHFSLGTFNHFILFAINSTYIPSIYILLN